MISQGLGPYGGEQKRNYPFNCFPTVVYRDWKLILRAHAVVDVNDFYIGLVAHLPAPGRLRL